VPDNALGATSGGDVAMHCEKQISRASQLVETNVPIAFGFQ